MGVDVVLMVSIVTERHGSYDVGYYFINTRNHSIFKREGEFAPNRFNDNIALYTKYYFDDFGKID